MGYARETRFKSQEMVGPQGQRLRRYTAFLVEDSNPDLDDGSSCVEEIDLDATDEQAAEELAEQLVERDYMPGLKVGHVEERHGLYL